MPIAAFFTVTYVRTRTPEHLCQHVANLADVWLKTFRTLPANRRWPGIQVSLCRPRGSAAIKRLLLPQSLSSHIHVSRQDQARPWFACFGGRRLHKWTSEPLFTVTHWFWPASKTVKMPCLHLSPSSANLSFPMPGTPHIRYI